MVICGSFMFEFSASKDVKNIYNKGRGNREGSGTFMSKTIYQGIEN
jgi:hypothetical protein